MKKNTLGLFENIVGWSLIILLVALTLKCIQLLFF